MSHQEIVFHRDGQRFVYSAPEGRPDDSPVPTVEVIDSIAHVPATSGTCRVDDTATTLAQPAARGGLWLELADARAIRRDRRYMLSAASGEHECVAIRAIDGDRVVLRRPLLHRYAKGATLVGVAIEIDVALPWAYDKANLSNAAARQTRGFIGYRLRWTYHVHGFRHVGITHVDLVREDEQQHRLVTPADVERRCPGWLDAIAARDRADQSAAFIAEAYLHVRLDALADDRTARRVRDASVLRELVTIRAFVIALEDEVLHGRKRAADLEAGERYYRARYAQLVLPPRPAPIVPAPAPPRARRTSMQQIAQGSEIRRRPPKLTNH